MARPVISVAVTGALLVAATVPLLNMNLGSVGISSLPDDSNARHAFDTINKDFSDGVLTADIVIDAAQVDDPSIQSAIATLTGSLAADGFFGATKIEANETGNLALLTVAMPGDFSSASSQDALERLRGRYIPAAFHGVSAKVLVGGATAETVDSVQTQRDYLPLVFAFVLGFSFLLLLVVFRSIVVPLKAVGLNLLSVGAAYGMLVLVFQDGIGAGFLGLREAPVIESWLPLFLFAILFGLSMDYHVFLLSRIKEHYDETGDNKASVAHGLRSTAGIITGAALIMVVVFAGMASGQLVVFQQVGFGLAVAVILDATIIRMVLVPASMELLGDWNWYFPTWLEWLPKINIEGAHKTSHAADPAAASAVSIDLLDGLGASAPNHCSPSLWRIPAARLFRDVSSCGEASGRSPRRPCGCPRAPGTFSSPPSPKADSFTTTYSWWSEPRSRRGEARRRLVQPRAAAPAAVPFRLSQKVVSQRL